MALAGRICESTTHLHEFFEDEVTFRGGAGDMLYVAPTAEGFAKFPTGPGLTDPFWVYMLTWHIGLFLTLTLAKIGYEGKKEGYFGDDA